MRSLHKTHPKQSALTTVSSLYVFWSQSSIQVPKSPLLPLKVVLSEKKMQQHTSDEATNNTE